MTTYPDDPALLLHTYINDPRITLPNLFQSLDPSSHQRLFLELLTILSSHLGDHAEDMLRMVKEGRAMWETSDSALEELRYEEAVAIERRVSNATEDRRRREVRRVAKFWGIDWQEKMAHLWATTPSNRLLGTLAAFSSKYRDVSSAIEVLKAWRNARLREEIDAMLLCSRVSSGKELLKVDIERAQRFDLSRCRAEWAEHRAESLRRHEAMDIEDSDIEIGNRTHGDVLHLEIGGGGFAGGIARGAKGNGGDGNGNVGEVDEGDILRLVSWLERKRPQIDRP